MLRSDPAEDSYTDDSSPDPHYGLEQEGESDGTPWRLTYCGTDASAQFEWGEEECRSDLPPSSRSAGDESQWGESRGSSLFDGFESPPLRTSVCEFSVAYAECSAEYGRELARPLVTAPKSEVADDSLGEESTRDVSFASRLQIQVADHLEDVAPVSLEETIQRRYDLYQHAVHRRALQRRVDLANQREAEHRLRAWPTTRSPPSPSPSPPRTFSAPSRSSLSRCSSCDSLRVHRHRPKGHICKAFVKDLKKKVKAEIDNDAWETNFKFPDFSLGIIPESYCIRSEFFEYDLFTQYGEVPGYPEGRGILESRSSKMRRGKTEAFSRKRKHDEEYENEMCILYDSKDFRTFLGKSSTPHAVEINKEELSSDIVFQPAKRITKAIQVCLDSEHECDEHCSRNYNSPPGTDEGYETTKSTVFSSMLKHSDILRMSRMKIKKQFSSVASIPSKSNYGAPGDGKQRPKRLPPMPGRKHLEQKLSATNSDSRLELRLMQKNRHLPPIGERGQGDEPYKYVPTSRKFVLPSKYPCLPPISRTQDSPTASSHAQMCRLK